MSNKKIYALHCLIQSRLYPTYQNNSHICVTDQSFQRLVDAYLDNNYSIVSLTDFLAAGRNEKVVSFTFDDGYFNNIDHSLNTLIKRRLPFAMFLTQKFIVGDRLPYWFIYDYYLSKLLGPFVRIKLNALRLARFSRTRYRSLSVVDKFLWEKIPVDLKDKVRFCTVDEIRNFANNYSQLTIGNHAVSHEPLSLMPQDDALNEIEECHHFIFKNFGVEAEYFASPFGIPRYSLKAAHIKKYATVFSALEMQSDFGEPRTNLCEDNVNEEIVNINPVG